MPVIDRPLALHLSHLLGNTPLLEQSSEPPDPVRPDLDELESRWQGDFPKPQRRRRRGRGGRGGGGIGCGSGGGRRRYAISELKRILVELKPWCVCCGRTVQNADDQRVDYALLFGEELHCRRCHSRKKAGNDDLPESAMAAVVTLEIEAAESAEPIKLEIPVELWRKFSLRCNGAGLSVSRVIASMLLNKPTDCKRRLDALRVWEHSHHTKVRG